MRKFFWILLTASVLLTGCRKEEAVPAVMYIPDELETAPETMPEIVTETEAVPIEERAAVLTVSEHQHIYDECHVLTGEEFQMHTEYLEELSSSRQVNAFVVITDHLDGFLPEQFAERYYQAVADTAVPDGFLILINNDTNQDMIYTAGNCSVWISQEDSSAVLAGATRDLVEKRFSEALSRILTISEKIPAFDMNY